MATDLNARDGKEAQVPDTYDADRLLSVAEQLQDKCEARERDILVRVMCVVALVIAALGLMVYPLPDTSSRMITIMVLGVLFSLTVAAVIIRGIMRIRRQLVRERRAMNEIVDMLREFGQALADKQHWPEYQRAAFRIRLSRFDIGPDYYRKSPSPRP